MPYGGNDWLALTPETTLEPEMPICDPHHHFWDFRVDRIPYQRYLLHELAVDVNSGHNIRSTVFVEARSMYRKDGTENLRSVGEVEFVQPVPAGCTDLLEQQQQLLVLRTSASAKPLSRSWMHYRRQALIDFEVFAALQRGTRTLMWIIERNKVY